MYERHRHWPRLPTTSSTRPHTNDARALLSHDGRTGTPLTRPTPDLSPLANVRDDRPWPACADVASESRHELAAELADPRHLARTVHVGPIVVLPLNATCHDPCCTCRVRVRAHAHGHVLMCTPPPADLSLRAASSFARKNSLPCPCTARLQRTNVRNHTASLAGAAAAARCQACNVSDDMRCARGKYNLKQRTCSRKIEQAACAMHNTTNGQHGMCSTQHTACNATHAPLKRSPLQRRRGALCGRAESA
jgi:hypothetical protein